MNRRDKLVLAGSLAVVSAIGLTAAFTRGDDTAGTEALTSGFKQPISTAAVQTELRETVLPDSVVRRMDKLPDEIPQDVKETENYLLKRWGHMDDAGLTAPGIMGEGEMYFQERKVLVGIRGNGEPAYAKAIIRPEPFDGPAIHAGQYEGLARNPSASSTLLQKNAAGGSLQGMLRKTEKAKAALGMKNAKKDPTFNSGVNSNKGKSTDKADEKDKDSILDGGK